MVSYPIKSKKLISGSSIPLIGICTYGLTSLNEIQEIVSFSLNKADYSYIDTSRISSNMDLIGYSIQKNLQRYRNNIFISCTLNLDDMSFEGVIDATQTILLQLNINFIDLLLLPWPNLIEDRINSWKACEFLFDQGVANGIGVSNFKKRHLESLINNRQINYKPCVNQIEVHPLYYDKKTIDFCRHNSILIQAYCPLATNCDKLIKNSLINNISIKYNKSPQQIALRWGVQNEFSVLPRSKNLSHILENSFLWDFELTNTEMNEIQSLNIYKKYEWDPDVVED